MSKERPILFSTDMVRAILDGRKTQTRRIKCRCEPGDILWVMEAWRELKWAYFFKSGEPRDKMFKWKPSLFMPRKACRLLLRVEDVRTERLKDITEEDAEREGFQKDRRKTDGTIAIFARNNFRHLWDKLNAQRGFGWDANPIVYVISFSVIKEEP